MEPMPTRFRLQAMVERLAFGDLRESSKGSPIPLGLDLMFRIAPDTPALLVVCGAGTTALSLLSTSDARC